MGVVHLALDRSGRAVALKLLRPHIAYDPDARSRLAREVDVLGRVQDPRVAAVIDADLDGDQPYVVTRYVPGPSLDEVVREHGPLAGRELLRLGQRPRRGPRRDPRGRRHPPRPQARQRAAPRRRPGRHRLRHRPHRRRRAADHDGPGHGHARLPLARGGRGRAGHRGHGLVGLGGDPGLRRLRAPRPSAAGRWTSCSTGSAGARPTSPGSTRGSPRCCMPRCRRTRASAPDADEVVEALERYAAGKPATEVAARSPGRTAYPGHRPAGDRGPGTAARRRRPVAAGRPRAVAAPGPAPTPARRPPGQRPRPLGRPRPTTSPTGRRPGRPTPASPTRGSGDRNRSGTLLALLLTVVAVAASWPVVAAVAIVSWCWMARTAERSVTSLVMRRHHRGRRRSDVPFAVAASPWHLVVGALGTLMGAAAARAGRDLGGLQHGARRRWR